MSGLPEALSSRAFTRRQALSAGVSQRQLSGDEVVRVHHGVYLPAGVEATLALLVEADLLILPPDAALSHTTALAWYGLTLGPAAPRHYSTNTSAQVRSPSVALHRRRHRLHPRAMRGVPVLGPDRTVVDCSGLLSPRQLVQAGDWLVRHGHTTREQLDQFTADRHFDGVVLARSAASLVRDRVDSVLETDLRLLLITSGLPEPAVNLDIHSDDGTFLARGDLVLVRWRIIIEYDGWQHERDAAQRQKDIYRRERLEAAGWTMIVVTIADLRDPAGVIARVHGALLRAGYRGVPPRFDRRAWHRLNV